MISFAPSSLCGIFGSGLVPLAGLVRVRNMAKIRPPLPVKLFIGLLSSDRDLLDRCAALLQDRFGPLDFRSPAAPWDHTDHYARELGDGLLRTFLFFDNLIDPGDLPEIKHFTNSIENRLSTSADGSARRLVNIDPGYLTEARVVLASAKDYAHRVYIGNNIYAEATLLFRDGSFRVRDHTYPDFRADEVIKMFNSLREVLRKQLQQQGASRL